MTKAIDRSTLSTETITCIPLSVEHAEAHHEAIVESGDSWSQWMAWYHPNFTVEETRGWAEWCTQAWSDGNHFEFAVFDAQAVYLGSCGLGNVNQNLLSANLQYWTRSTHAGRGIGSSAARLVSGWGIRELGLVRIEVLMATANVSSRRAAERSGAVFEGILRNRMRWAGKNYDACLFSFTPEDFE